MSYPPDASPFTPPPPAASAPRSSSTDGFFAGLFDFGFTRFVSLKIIKIVYILAFSLASLWALLVFVWFVQLGGAFILLGLIVAPLIWVFTLAVARISYEAYAVLFRINDNIAYLAGQAALVPHPGLDLTAGPPAYGATPAPAPPAVPPIDPQPPYGQFAQP